MQRLGLRKPNTYCPPAVAEFDNAAILFLVDQSGSMKGEPMAWVAAGLRHLADDLAHAGGSVEIVGFTTAGWRGGFAREKWLANKRPKRPGRLCALLYIRYKKFEEPTLLSDAWKAMLDPNILRENVDGEALVWASEKLAERGEQRKMLVVVSDGAPVDDSTLMENGESYLHNHLQRTVAEIQALGRFPLAAIGVNYDLALIYENTIALNVGDDFRATALDLIRRFV
jgi:cobaltochelatase CobT